METKKVSELGMNTESLSKQNNSTFTSKYKQVEETPFTIVENEGNIVIVIGNQLASKKVFESFEDAEEYIRTKSWELITTTVAILTQKFK